MEGRREGGEVERRGERGEGGREGRKGEREGGEREEGRGGGGKGRGRDLSKKLQPSSSKHADSTMRIQGNTT